MELVCRNCFQGPTVEGLAKPWRRSRKEEEGRRERTAGASEPGRGESAAVVCAAAAVVYRSAGAGSAAYNIPVAYA